MASPLTAAQRDHYESQGYLMVRGALGGQALAALGAELAGWVEESRRHKANWGDCLDGRRGSVAWEVGIGVVLNNDR